MRRKKPSITLGLWMLWLALMPVQAQGDYQKGISYFKQGQYQKAISEFEPLVKEHPDYESGHRILGLCYLRLKQYEPAISSFRAALRLKKDAIESYLGLAQAYFNSKRYSEVIPTLDQGASYAQSPKSRHDLLRLRGIAAFNLRQYDRAVADLEEANRIQSGETADLLQIGLAYLNLRRFENAEIYFEQVLARVPDHPEAQKYLLETRYQQGLALIEEKRYTEAAKAISAYTQEFDRYPDHPEAWFNLGLAYLFADNLKAAEEAFLRDTRLRPDAAGESFDRLGYIYEKGKKYGKALENYKKAAQLTGSSDSQASVARVQKRIEQEGP